MQTLTLEISLLVNAALIALVLSLVYPKLIERYRKEKTQRERRKNNKIKKIVRDYLDELKK